MEIKFGFYGFCMVCCVGFVSFVIDDLGSICDVWSDVL